MEDLILQLKTRAQQASAVGEDLFELVLGAACSYCCTQYTGGNQSCPPKPAMQSLS
jgi:hypothetical protein